MDGPQVAADDAERRAGVVGDFRARRDAAVYLAGHVRQVGDPFGDLGEERQPVRGRAAGSQDGLLEGASGRQRSRDVQQLRRLEDAAEVRLVRELSNVVDAAEAGARLHLAKASRFGGEPLIAQHLIVVVRGAQREGKLAAGGEGGVAGQAREDLVELEGVEGLFVHGDNIVADR